MEAWALNTAWMVACQKEVKAFRKATAEVAVTQARVLARILRANQGSQYGQKFGFEAIADPTEFQKRVPVVEYDDLAPWINEIASGKQNVLTTAPVERLVPTSGTTQGEKWIPYTSELRREFRRGISTWIGDLYRHCPGVRCGRAYWSISPNLGDERRTQCGLPIGLPDDTAYLGRLEQIAMRRLLAVPNETSKIQDLSALRYATLYFLLQAKDLALVSVWNPSFFTLLLEPLRDWGEQLCHDMARGKLTGPHQAGLVRHFQALRPRLKRAGEVTRLISRLADNAELYSALWPRLSVISCWTDAAAVHSLDKLRQTFPNVTIQPKGLLATEGFVSLAMWGSEGAALALRSHYFEFVERGKLGEVRLAHELEIGVRYSILLTTSGGFYRYALHDEVVVTGFLRDCPLLRFLGRDNRTSDLVGEKLSEQQAQDAIHAAAEKFQMKLTFALMAPVLVSRPGYRLFIQGDVAVEHQKIAEEVELGLFKNPYYRHAVTVGQLAPLKAQIVPPQLNAAQIFEQRRISQGQRAGDIKPAILDSWTGWPEVLGPR